MGDPRFSFIIPVKEITPYVREVLHHLVGLSDPGWEAFVVSNLDEGRPLDDARVTYMSSGRVGPADKRDMAAASSKGDWLIFLDDDSYPARNYLDILSNLIRSGYQAFAGPGVTPADDTYRQRVSGAMYTSKLLGGNPERYIPTRPAKVVDDWPSVNLVIRRDVFQSVGGFDCKFWPGEDTFLCDKLTARNIQIWYEPDLIVWHHRRDSLRGHLKQAGAYGLHRGYFARHFARSSRRPAYFAPSALLILVACTALGIAIRNQYVWIPGAFAVSAYIIAILLGSLALTRSLRWPVALGVVPYAISTHMWYGARFLQGLLKRGALESTLR